MAGGRSFGEMEWMTGPKSLGGIVSDASTDRGTGAVPVRAGLNCSQYITKIEILSMRGFIAIPNKRSSTPESGSPIMRMRRGFLISIVVFSVLGIVKMRAAQALFEITW